MKIVMIFTCDECPFFDYSYYEYNEICTKTGKRIIGMHIKEEYPNNRYFHPLPNNCPLEDAEEV